MIIESAMQRIRTRVLAGTNQRRLRQGIADIDPKSTPIYFIFTPEISHLARYCIPNTDSRFSPVLVMNAVPDEDIQWIRSIHPTRPIIELRYSLSGNSRSLLPHGDVLNDLLSVTPRNFCIQDPDCFVIDDQFWDQVAVGCNDFASGPFCSRAFEQDHELPYTYFLMFNSDAFQRVSSKYGIDARVIRNLPKAAGQQAADVGYGVGQYPNQGKDYFDTLQAYWVLSLAEGLSFRAMPGEGESIFHIGGTSYLHKSAIELSHWDYWPLSVHYFNLRILELPELTRFRKRYQMLFDAYESSSALLENHAEFRQGWRCREIEKILARIL